MDECRMVEGIVIDKEFSHPQMTKELKDAKMCILTCPFEPPKPKTKNQIEIDSAEKYAELAGKLKLVEDSIATFSELAQ